jgi:hypothetical protein
MSQHSKITGRVALTAVGVVALVGTIAFAGASASDAAQRPAQSCTVAIDYNGVAQYQGNFVVSAQTPFVDDQSTAHADNVFTATLAGKTVTIDYFKDLNVFDNIHLVTSAVLNGGQGTATGSSEFSNSASGNHLTSYSLACHR